MLPPSSWHMTIFDGVCDLVRPSAGGVWPADLPADVSLSECTAHFAAKLSSPSFSLRPEEQPPYKMRVVGFKPLGTAIMVRVEEGEKGEGVGLRGLRDRLAEKLGVRRPGHEGYVLHVSLGYLLRWLSEEEEGAVMGLLMEHFGRWGEDGVMGKGREFELGRGEFCRFEDMMAFERLCYLGEGEEGRKGVD
ncbi:RNA ligase/cyclic nucleotide phosphodiesterase [Bombardia bombarda]|uniref:RNA ligase/cyclic nucleotide phosphodiesterase n=1 Tax=Bombardia bombarda TaxID=252184 RepID=A0AA39WZX1_9PEZI|nr:RNA ligase/cyclic nucleotide phosphodiesterase [Bombardia bombarda]